jgi:ketosteroid isomerase-like protein
MRVVTGFGLALALGLAGCQPKTETPEQAQARMDTETASVRSVIDSLDAEFSSHFTQGHADLVAAMYSDQAHLMPPNQPVAVGKDAIKAAFAPFFAMKSELKLTADAVSANGDLVIERGTYTVTFTPEGATAPTTDTGKYLVHWHRLGGKWLIADDIWNSDLPAMPMGAPPKNP